MLRAQLFYRKQAIFDRKYELTHEGVVLKRFLTWGGGKACIAGSYAACAAS